MPVICGGTNYYIESLLWNVLADSSPSDSSTIEPIDKISKDDTNDNITTKDLYEKLKDIDPERAEHLHPNERRKILRSLQSNFLMAFVGDLYLILIFFICLL